MLHSAASLAGAMIIILWAYAGWHEAAYIVSEMKNRTRNIPLALIFGTLIVTAIYLSVNLAYLLGLDAAELQRRTLAPPCSSIVSGPAAGRCGRWVS